jgi:hypothetical protein
MEVTTHYYRLFVVIALLLVGSFTLTSLIRDARSGQPDQPDE